MLNDFICFCSIALFAAASALSDQPRLISLLTSHFAAASHPLVTDAGEQAIALLPFIDEKRLLNAVKDIDKSGSLSDAENARNQFGDDLYYTPKGSECYTPAKLPDGHARRVESAAFAAQQQ